MIKFKRIISTFICMTMLCSLVNVPVLADSYNWPLYENTYISSYFGGRIHPLTGKAQNHSGIDIPASKGTEVHAANSGTVYIMCTSCTHNYGKSSSCGCGGGYGNYLYIQHGDGLRTYYCHLTSITVENGSHVSTGDVVGTVGSTGSSTGFHLHFEMRNGASNNTRIDPLNYVSSGEVVPDVTYNDPIFNLDSCSGGVGTVSVRGWAFDDDDISQSIPVHVYVGGPAGDPNAEGYPIIADVFRDDVNIAYGCGNYHGFDASIKVTKTGTQPIYIYACNIGSGSTQLIAQKTLTITSPDTEVPVITNARIENVTNQGYDVICNVTDNLNVNRVQFVTWSDNNGQDDIAQGWDSNPIIRGTENNNGEYEFHVNISEHFGDRGLYATHIYAYDDYGNKSGYPLTVTIPGYDYCFDEVTLSDNSLYVKGWAAAVNGFDEINAVLTDENNKSITYDISNRYYRNSVAAYRPDWDTTLAGFDETFDISGLKTGNIKMEVSATTDGNTYVLYNNLITYSDKESPVITNARVVNLTNQGYTVICNVTDNINVNRVQFATWSDADGQDDLPSDWEINPNVSGMKNNNGEYEFQVNIWEHMGHRGLYFTHIYAFDDSGNTSFIPLTPIVPGYDTSFDSATLDKRNLTVSGWAASINGIENLKLTVTDRKGKTNSYDITNRFSLDDVTTLRPDWNTETAGYSQTFDLSDLASGSAVIEITGELYQEDVEKATYSLGRKVIDLKDNLSVNVSVNNNEYFTGEAVEFSVNSIGEENLYIYIYNEDGLYNKINMGSNDTYIKAFDEPGTYFVNAEAIGYEGSLLSDNVYFTVLEAPELEPDAEEYIVPTEIALDRTSTTINVGSSETLTATVLPTNATNKAVTWSSSNTNVATVSSSGVVTAKAAGTATITATTADGSKTATCNVTVVTPTVSVTGVSLNKTSTTINVGSIETLAATVAPTNATNTSVTWKSSNTNVATVSSSGVVTAKAAGTATITATTADGSKTTTCTVTVVTPTVSVTGISMNKTSTTISVGTTETLTATVVPSNATNKEVTWTSSNTNVATVSSSGVVTAKSAGTATIIATTTDGGKIAICNVTVTLAAPEITSLTASVMNEYVLINTSVVNVHDNAKSYIVAYDGSGNLIAVQAITFTDDENQTILPIKNISKIKALVWETDNITPLTRYKEYVIK